MELKPVGNKSNLNSNKKITQNKIDESFLDFFKTAGEASSGKVDSLHSVNPFLALQEIDSYQTDQQKMLGTGKNLLTHLNDIRLALINGDLNKEHINNLKKTLSQQKLTLKSPELQQVIDEIYLRAEVELAKLEVTEDQNTK